MTRRKASPKLLSKRENFVVISGLVIIVTILLILLISPPQAKPSIRDKAPEITWNSGTLSDYFGHIVFLNFMDTDCSHCREDAPTLVALQDRWSDVKFLSINVRFIGDDDSQEEILAFREEYGISWLILNDNLGDNTIAGLYEVTRTPTNIILDHELIIRYSMEGAKTYTIYDEVLLTLGTPS